MTRNKMLLITATVLIAGVVFLVFFVGPRLQRSFFYPTQRGLPDVVTNTTAELLARLQSVLETNVPMVAQSLQPGLTDVQISALETEGGFHLSDDLRSFYKWHNGTVTNSTIGIVPGQRFLPLDEFVREQALVRQQAGAMTMFQRVAVVVLTRHRKDWVTVLDDGAGGGYFFDPKRKETEGAFFYHFSESSHYLWFPSFRNFLFGTIESYESHAVKLATDGKSLEEDFSRTKKIWERLAKLSGSESINIPLSPAENTPQR